MTDYDDLEAAMYADQEQAERARRARARVDAHTHEAIRARPDREQHRNAVRTDQLHDTPLIHDWLLDLEGQVINLLHPDDQDYFRRRQ